MHMALTSERLTPSRGARGAALERPRKAERSASHPRLGYVDGLKVALTALVIAHHAGQAYGPTGGRWPIFEPERAGILGPFFAVNASFFMGLFFLISAYFLPQAFDRTGAQEFLKDRLPASASHF
jgi:peptidoglycan/LPS O-acetylase OafA/YrhL